MKWVKIINIVSIYGLILFAFLAVAMVRKPSYLPFAVTDEMVNICCIVFMMYMAVFLVTYCMQKSQDQQQKNDQTPLKHHSSDDNMIEKEIDDEPQLKQKDEVQIEEY